MGTCEPSEFTRVVADAVDEAMSVTDTADDMPCRDTMEAARFVEPGVVELLSYIHF